MHAPPLHRPSRTPAALVPVLAILVSVLAAPATASAGATITQGPPEQGTVLVGNAFTDQLQVTGATGPVTFVQTAGSDSVSVSSSGQVSALSSLAAGTYTASGTDSDTNGDNGTWTYTLDVLQSAPSGFSTTVVNVYQSEYSVAQQLGRSSALETVSQYQQSVAQLNQTELATLYYATQQYPEWAQIPALMQTVASAVPGSGLTSTSTTMSANQPARVKNAAVDKVLAQTRGGPSAPSKAVSSRSTGAGLKSGGPTLKYNSAMSSASVGLYAPNGDSDVSPFQDCSSDPNIPDAAIFAVQIVIDVAYGVYDIASIFGDVGAAVSIPSAVVLTAAQITEDTLNYEALPASECETSDQYGYIANIDNTTTQNYALLTALAAAVTQLQSTGTTTQQDVENVATQLTNLQQTFVTTIANDTQTLQTTVGSDTQAVTTQLEQDLTALKGDVGSIETDEQTLSQNVIKEVDTDSSSVQSDLSGDLTKILSEVDSQANALTTLVTQDNQQVMGTLQANFKTQQSEYYSGLKVKIEQALAAWGSIVPPVQYILPASQGGFLNSTPVGVQEVVTDDLNALTADGISVQPATLNELKAANAALAAGQYVTAYGDYAKCYEQFA